MLHYTLISSCFNGVSFKTQFFGVTGLLSFVFCGGAGAGEGSVAVLTKADDYPMFSFEARYSLY